MVLQSPPIKRKRGRPRKETIEQRAEGDSPLWAIVDQLTLIHDDLKELVILAKAAEGPATGYPSEFSVGHGVVHGQTL